jgi:hypothetical protein
MQRKKLKPPERRYIPMEDKAISDLTLLECGWIFAAVLFAIVIGSILSPIYQVFMAWINKKLRPPERR